MTFLVIWKRSDLCQKMLRGEVSSYFHNNFPLLMFQKNINEKFGISHFRVIVHRQYDAATFENDLALLELESPVRYDSHIGM